MSKSYNFEIKLALSLWESIQYLILLIEFSLKFSPKCLSFFGQICYCLLLESFDNSKLALRLINLIWAFLLLLCLLLFVIVLLANKLLCKPLQMLQILLFLIIKLCIKFLKLWNVIWHQLLRFWIEVLISGL